MPCPDIYSGDQRVPLRAALIRRQNMLQCCCQFVTMQGDHTVVVIACSDDHGRVLPAAACWRLHIVYRTVWVDVSKVLCLIWIPVVTRPCMPCIHHNMFQAPPTAYRTQVQMLLAVAEQLLLHVPHCKPAAT